MSSRYEVAELIDLDEVSETSSILGLTMDCCNTLSMLALPESVED